MNLRKLNEYNANKLSNNKKLLKIMAKKELKRKAQLTVKEVAWAGKSPTKYQAFLEYQVSEERTIRICGDPKSSQEKAVDSLCVEKLLWEEAMGAFNEVKI